MDARTDDRDAVKRLNGLIDGSVDAVHAYTQALRYVDAPLLRGHLEGFCDDHLRHITVLADAVRALDGQVPPARPDFGGPVLAQVSALREGADPGAALRALRHAEAQIERAHEAALRSDLPAVARAAVQRCADDERRHRSFLAEALETDATWRAGRSPA
jgi:hypothetical protein